MPIIEVKDLVKEFKIYKHDKGLMNSLKGLFKPEYDIKRAVDNINFSINKGELVGYIGPNGAGKSTTIKMLTGILYPTSGEISVNGYFPHNNRRENAMKIGVVFGQRSQLYWDLPIEETFEVFKKMYKIEDHRFKENLDFYIDLLQMQEFLRRPVRQLSLGQKMRANLAITFLHDPDIVYLDEPTIGLDVLAKDRIRKFIREVNKEKSTTVILTTHDMDDIEEICDRIIMIDKGKVIHDGSLKAFKDNFSGGSVLVVDFSDEKVNINTPGLDVIKSVDFKKWIAIDTNKISTAEAIRIIVQQYDIRDISIREPEIENIVRDIYLNNSGTKQYVNS
jgi:ABC-2 type transport system ATP-binding protein